MSTLTVKDVKVKKVLITPQMAQEFLAKNTRNRPHNQRKVEEYVKMMKDNEWHLQTDAIGFDTNDKLINGQHRMMAVTQYGKPIEFLVATGLEPDSFNFIDTGKNRSSGDVLGANGFVAGAHKSAIIRFVIGYKKGNIQNEKSSKRDLGLNNQDILDYAHRYRNELEEAYKVSTDAAKSFKGLKGQAIGGMYWILSKIDRNRALVFFGALGTGTMLTHDDPIYILRQRLMDDLAAKKKFPLKDKLAWLIMAWNHSKKGSKIKQLKWNGEVFPKPE